MFFAAQFGNGFRMSIRGQRSAGYDDQSGRDALDFFAHQFAVRVAWVFFGDLTREYFAVNRERGTGRECGRFGAINQQGVEAA